MIINVSVFNEKDCEQMKTKNLAKNTDNATTYAVKLLTKFCIESNVLGEKNIDELSSNELLPVCRCPCGCFLQTLKK